MYKTNINVFLKAGRSSALAGLLVALFLNSTAYAAALPDFAQEFLDTLPEKKLTMETVLYYSVTQSDSFRRIQAAGIDKEAAYLRTSALLAWRLEAEGQRVDDESAVNGFGPERTERTNYRFAISKQFETGSQMQLEFLNVDQNLRFPDSFTGFDNFIGNTRFSEPRVTLSLSQSLWKDSFGQATRDALEASRMQEKAIENFLVSQTGQWAYEISDLYYQAWLAQSKARADLENLKRQQRLLKIVQLQKRRGTSDTVDVLQVESSLKLAEQTVADSRQNVSRIFKTLVLSLGFPEKWLEVDGNLVPTKIDQPIAEASEICKSGWKAAAERNPKLKQLNSELVATEKQLEAAQGRVGPDLRLQVAASANGVQSDFGEAFEDVSAWRNPRYVMGVTVSMPLEQKQEKADILTSLTQKTSKQYELGQARTDLQAEWVANCENLQRLKFKVKEFRSMMGLQKDRVDREEKRFRIGKTGAFQVIQAGSDATNAELSYKRSQVEIRNVAWRIQQMNGSVASKILEMGKK
ncbi:MAG: TolC family protein [Bdellovibrionales bacterium]|nr:TolC family protein [Bdellovibrionales bacterium]